MSLVRSSAVVVVSASILTSACASVAPSSRQRFRVEQYLSTHGELLPSVRKAIEDGHVIVGMDREQVRAVLGLPVKATEFGRERHIQIWIYPGYRLHQDQLRADKAWLFRLVLIDGVLTIIEPI